MGRVREDEAYWNAVEELLRNLARSYGVEFRVGFAGWDRRVYYFVKRDSCVDFAVGDCRSQLRDVGFDVDSMSDEELKRYCRDYVEELRNSGAWGVWNKHWGFKRSVGGVIVSACLWREGTVQCPAVAVRVGRSVGDGWVDVLVDLLKDLRAFWS